MLTDVEIINQGLGKFASARINRINPPGTSLERNATGYTQWRRSEIAKHPWVFAREDDVVMPQTDYLITGVKRPYVYDLPTECLRPIRTKRAEWQQRGRKLYSAYSSLTVDLLLDKLEDEFDPLFVDVLALRCAMELVDLVTQSNVKRDKIEEWYDVAVDIAKKNNAWTVGDEDISSEVDDYPFLSSRGYNSL